MSFDELSNDRELETILEIFTLSGVNIATSRKSPHLWNVPPLFWKNLCSTNTTLKQR
jgi:hypothetical protein